MSRDANPIITLGLCVLGLSAILQQPQHQHRSSLALTAALFVIHIVIEIDGEDGPDLPSLNSRTVYFVSAQRRSSAWLADFSSASLPNVREIQENRGPYGLTIAYELRDLRGTSLSRQTSTHDVADVLSVPFPWTEYSALRMVHQIYATRLQRQGHRQRRRERRNVV